MANFTKPAQEQMFVPLFVGLFFFFFFAFLFVSRELRISVASCHILPNIAGQKILCQSQSSTFLRGSTLNSSVQTNKTSKKMLVA